MAVAKFRPHQKSAFIVATLTGNDARKHLVLATSLIEAITMVNMAEPTLKVIEAGSLNVDTIMMDEEVGKTAMGTGPSRIITGN